MWANASEVRRLDLCVIYTIMEMSTEEPESHRKDLRIRLRTKLSARSRFPSIFSLNAGAKQAMVQAEAIRQLPSKRDTKGQKRERERHCCTEGGQLLIKTKEGSVAIQYGNTLDVV